MIMVGACGRLSLTLEHMVVAVDGCRSALLGTLCGRLRVVGHGCPNGSSFCGVVVAGQVAVWDQGELYVVESTDSNPFGQTYWCVTSMLCCPVGNRARDTPPFRVHWRRVELVCGLVD